jgi:uncharacterized protein
MSAAGARPPAGSIAERLGRERYISLTTFRRDGRPVATPVWVVADGDRLLVWTGETSGKAKRARRNAEVTVAPCDMRGRVRGAALAGVARVLPDEAAAVQQRILRKYGLVLRLLLWSGRLSRAIRRRPAGRSVAIEITLAAPAR